MIKDILHIENIGSVACLMPVLTSNKNAGSLCGLAFFISNIRLITIPGWLISSNQKQKLPIQPNDSINKQNPALTCDCQPGLHDYFKSLFLVGVFRGHF
jgi:hypothetical protein